MNQLEIRGIRLKTTIGVYPFEQKMLQTLLIDLQLTLPHLSAAQSDDIKDALDYALLVDSLIERYAAKQTQLIETVAEEITQWLLAEYPIDDARVIVTKPHAIAQAAGVSIIIERNREN